MADNRKYVATKPTTLSSSTTSTGTSITVSELEDRAGNTLTLTDFGTTGYGVFEPGGSNEEHCLITGVSGTTLTVTRGIAMKAPYTETTALKKAHAAGTKFVVYSNTPAFFDTFTNKNDTETITEKWTFPTSGFPEMSDSTTAPILDEELATKKYVDDTAGGNPVTKDATVVPGTAGETVAAGEAVYLDETDNEWKLTDASASATSDNVMLGIAQGAGTNGAAITGGVLLNGRDDSQSGLTQGDKLFLSDTPGAISSSAGTVEVEIGHAVDADSMDFVPKFASYTTKDQRDALASTSGTPSSTNKYTSENDTSNGSTITATTIAFVDSNPDTITDSGNGFVTAGFRAGQTIVVTGSASNNSSFTLVTVAAGTLTLDAADALVVEAAGATVTIVTENTSKLVRTSTSDKIADAFLQMTSAQATTLTDGSDANALHVHPGSRGIRFVDSLRNNTDTRITVAVNGTGTNTFGSADLTQSVPAINDAAVAEFAVTTTNLTFAADFSFSCMSKLTAAGSNRRGLAFAQVSETTGGAVTSGSVVLTARHFGFQWQYVDNSTLTLKASSADGTTQETTTISGVTLTAVNVYEVIHTPTQDLFYVNGTLEATHTTNVASGANAIGAPWRVSAHHDSSGGSNWALDTEEVSTVITT